MDRLAPRGVGRGQKKIKIHESVEELIKIKLWKLKILNHFSEICDNKMTVPSTYKMFFLLKYKYNIARILEHS